MPVDELDELESAADEVVVVLADDGENGWLSAKHDRTNGNELETINLCRGNFAWILIYRRTERAR